MRSNCSSERPKCGSAPRRVLRLAGSRVVVMTIPLGTRNNGAITNRRGAYMILADSGRLLISPAAARGGRRGGKNCQPAVSDLLSAGSPLSCVLDETSRCTVQRYGAGSVTGTWNRSEGAGHDAAEQSNGWFRAGADGPGAHAPTAAAAAGTGNANPPSGGELPHRSGLITDRFFQRLGDGVSERHRPALLPRCRERCLVLARLCRRDDR